MTGRRILAVIKLTLFMLAVMCFSGISAMAEEKPQFILDIELLELDVSSNTGMTITMINAKGATVKEIVGMDWGYPSDYGTEKSTKEINGSMAYVETLNYDVYPYDPGQYVIWATIDYNGQTYMTNKLTITVRDDSVGDDGRTRNAFLQTVLSDNKVYVGQKTVLSYELYSKYETSLSFFLDDLHIDNILSFKAPDSLLKTENVMYNGNKFIKTVTEVSFLTPLKPGLYTIPASTFYAYASEETQSAARMLSEPKELIVNPLPTQNQPSDFSWIIGKLKIDAKYNTTKVDDGSLSLTVTVSGDCNIDSLNKIFNEDLPNFAVFEYEKSYTESFINSQYNAEKEFEITLIPKTNGELTIEPIYITYFDPETATYEKAEIPGVTVTIDGEDRSIQTVEEHTQKAEDGANEALKGNRTVETVRIEQISYAPANDGFWTIRVNKAIAISIIVLLILGGAVIYFLKRPKKVNDPLDDLYAKLLKANDGNEIYNLFSSMIKHCFGLSLKASSRSELSSAITDKRLVDPIIEVVEHVENAKYAPGKVDKKLVDMIKDIYRMLRERKK